MPRRKKNDQSPARLPGGPPEGGSLGHNSGYPLPQLYEGAMASNFPGSTSVSSADKEKMVRSMQEMFSHLDPEVIYIVLSESEFKVENAMDSLLELSVAAEAAAPIPSPVSGFELTAAALLSPSHFSKPAPDPNSSKPLQQPPSPPSTNLLTEELDLLVDQELQTLTALQDLKEEHHSKYLPAGASLSSFPPPPVPQQALPELLQSSLEPGFRGPSAEQPGPVGGLSGASSPLNQLSTWEDDTAEGQQSVVDFTHLMTETSADKSKPPLDLAASGRPSAFQVYKKQDLPHAPLDRTQLMHSDALVGGARSKVNMLNREQISSPWNPEAPVFLPRIHGTQGPAFITPVAQSPSNWPSQPRHASPWLNQGPVSQAPLKPSATIPKSWAVSAAPQVTARCNRLRLEGKLLVLLRGAPGSGKSTLARALLEQNPGGVILSTDDYYYHNGTYQFDPTTLGEAHEWNHKRAKEAFQRGTKPIIIDNTNMQGWEMRPYVVQALKHGYKVLFREPDTWWKNKPRELERRSTHDVPVETIRRMLDGYERFVSIQSIMGSQMPERKRQLLENRGSQPLSPETPCPDLVDQPGLTEGCKKSRPQLFSSLPDVSSVGRSGEVGMLEDGTHKSTESLNVQLGETSKENPETSNGDSFDLGDLDSELDNQLNQLNPPNGDQRIPDCIVESVMNEDSWGTEMPVAFSESIAQRVRRERPSRRSGFDNMEPADLVKDTNQADSEAKEKEKTMEEELEGAELVTHMGEKGMHKVLNFAGDWPSEGSLEQRQVRKRETHKEVQGSKDEDASREYNDHEKTTSTHSGPNITEFQKLLDIIQTGVVTAETSSSHSRSISLSSGEELEKEDEAGGWFEESHGSRSNSEERKLNTGRVNINRGDLPDCVLDWKAADSCVVRELKIDDWEGLKIENEASTITERIDRESLSVDLKAPKAENSVSALFEKTKEENVAHNIEGETGTDVDSCTENGRESRTEADGCHISDTCQSIVCEGSVETESSPLSQEKKQRQGRRSGKQCKLALTFTQNCPDSLLNTLDSPNTTAQDLDNSQNSINSDVKPKFNPNPSLDLEPNLEARSETDMQEALPFPLVDTGCYTQTEPQDFALLWRLNRTDSPDDAVVTAGRHTGDIRVVSGDSSRFVPELSSAVSAAVAVHPSGHREVPYRVVHEKGTQVEERELGVTQDRLENLRILSRHFKLVSFDTLEDLYDKCHQDLEWTTNLLLDSGERFFRDEDGEEAEDSAAAEDGHCPSTPCEALSETVETSSCSVVLDQHHPEDWPKRETTVIKEETQQSTRETVTESDESANNTAVSSLGGAAVPVTNKDHSDTTPDSSPQAEPNFPKAVKEGESGESPEHRVISEPDLEDGAWGGSFDNGVTIETEDDIASLDEVNRLLLANIEEMEREKKKRKEERRSQHLSIQSVELKLPTELALQLTELFGPVGMDPGTCSADDYTVQMDLNLAKLLHQKWKETIQERHRQAALSFHLLQESSTHWGDSQVAKPGTQDRTPTANFLLNTDSYMSLDSQPDAFGQMPYMDHWNASRPHVSLRDIIKEEQALQENVKKTRQSRTELDRRDGATLLKENQLYALFPTIDRLFLQDIFRDHNYSLTQTELFLRSLLDEEPVKTVVAPEAPRSDHHRTASKEREKRQKPQESAVPNYQDTEDPEYTDFRAEANLQRSRQLESFSKAAEAYRQGRKEVASFYAQQGHLHGHRMREANHRAAVQIFERVNSSLLPKNILDLHGLHVDEALEHLAQVLQDKTTDCEQGLCRPQLSVITGRGNHSQGGVARIRPAVIDYLTNKHYRFTEPTPGLVLVSLK